MMHKLHLGNCLEILKNLEDNSVDSIVTDPPYGISFMEKKWDYDVPSEEIWKECLRVLKPGGHLLAFASTKTQHRMAVRIEDAGFEIRDMIFWAYSSGMPKGQNISKGIDKKFGLERKVVGTKIGKPEYSLRENDTAERDRMVYGKFTNAKSECETTESASKEAAAWEGWNTGLKPSVEPVTLARKPFTGSVVDNVLKWGTGGINVGACRVEDDNGGGSRYPANLIHDASEEVMERFPNNIKGGTWATTKGARVFQNNGKKTEYTKEKSDSSVGSAGRFFYVSKATKKDRNEGLSEGEINEHVTVKPTDLMRYLCKLVTPAGGIVLDPFMGSGSTGKAALLEGFHFIGIELEEKSFRTAQERVAAVAGEEGYE